MSYCEARCSSECAQCWGWQMIPVPWIVASTLSWHIIKAHLLLKCLPEIWYRPTTCWLKKTSAVVFDCSHCVLEFPMQLHTQCAALPLLAFMNCAAHVFMKSFVLLFQLPHSSLQACDFFLLRNDLHVPPC